MTRALSAHTHLKYLITVLLCAAASASAAYDAGWTRSDCAAYSYRGLNERYVYGGNKGWIDNDKWDSTSVEGVDCASYVCRALALPSYVAENKSATYPYTTSKLYAGVPHLVRIRSVQDLQPWDIWVWRVEYGGPSTGHTGFVKEITSSSIVTREALSANSGVVERTRRKQDMVDWGCRFYRRDNWTAGSTVTAPSAQTNSAGNIQPTSAVLNGAVVSDGGATIDSRGFAWGTTSDCDGGWIDGTTSTTFSGKLTGLNPDSRYYFKAMVHNSQGWGSGQVRSFVTGTIVGDGSEIIIDNGSSGTSSTGTWGVSGGSGSFGSNSLWARDGATYTWRFTPPSAGKYDVYMWWTEFSSRGTAIPVSISHAGGTASLTVNQQTDGGQWNLLGTYSFDGSGAVKLTARGSYPTSSCADAVRFVPVKSDNQAPLAVIDSMAPSAAEPGQQVTMTGHGVDDGSITAYQWSSSLDGVLGSTATLTTSALRVGVHTISFKVCDDEGLWSKAVVDTVTITEAPSVDEMIIDNGGAGTSYTGTWSLSGGSGFYGRNSLYGRDGATYTWGTTALSPGTYEVMMRWTEFSSRSTRVPIRIQHAEGTSDVTVNQQRDGGQWNSLGYYTFNGSGKVTLYAPDRYPTSYCADAVRFVKVETVNEEIVMDNGDDKTYYSGTWGVSGGTGAYGSNSLWAREKARYKWVFTPQYGGHYEVSLWWTEFSSRGSRIPVTVTSSSGSNALTVNQQTDGGQWNVLGTFPMTGGRTYRTPSGSAGCRINLSRKGKRSGASSWPLFFCASASLPKVANSSKMVNYLSRSRNSHFFAQKAAILNIMF